MGDRTDPYLLPAEATRVEGAVCEFTSPGCASGPVLHSHDDVDEGFFVVTGDLQMQLGDVLPHGCRR